MAIAEGSILEKPHGSVEIIELSGDVATAGAWFDEIETASVDGHVGLPILEMRIRTVVQEHRSLQSRVVTTRNGGKRIVVIGVSIESTFIHEN